MEQKYMRESFSKIEKIPFSCINTAENKDKRGRLQKIQQKLEAITIHRQNQAKQQYQEEMTRRILELQQKSTEDMKEMDTKIRWIRQQISQIRLKQAQMTKKCLLLRKIRAAQVIELQRKVNALLTFESKERKQAEIVFTHTIENRQAIMTRDIVETKELRIDRINLLEQQLQQVLPSQHYGISSCSEQLSENISIFDQEAQEKMNFIKNSAEKQQKQREKKYKLVKHQIAAAVQEIKNGLEVQRVDRQNNKQKILSLFQNACAKIHRM